ncbi:MAG: hypothetical protein R2778_18685 [Saprospiraceae bacterium]
MVASLNDDYTVDPVGSVSIIEMATGNVTTIGFISYNDKKVSLQNKGIRIFGNNGVSTVAQDIELEYIAVTEDGAYAYVGCQETTHSLLLI